MTVAPERWISTQSETFLQNNNRATQQAIGELVKRGVQHDYNSLALTYTRFGDFGYFLIIKQHFFPSNYGLENPKIAILNESPWHPSRVAENSDHQRLANEIFKFGEATAKQYDRAYMREASDSVPAFELK